MALRILGYLVAPTFFALAIVGRLRLANLVATHPLATPLARPLGATRRLGQGEATSRPKRTAAKLSVVASYDRPVRCYLRRQQPVRRQVGGGGVGYVVVRPESEGGGFCPGHVASVPYSLRPLGGTGAWCVSCTDGPAEGEDFRIEV